MKKLYLIAMLLCMLCVQAMAQRTISGKVTDANNLTLPGVNILVKGTNVGTVTDIDGQYSLKVPENAKTLLFSYIGYRTFEKELGSENTIEVTLEEDALGLDEVVVTAIGISREKKALGYAAQVVKGDDLLKARETNVVNSLSGKVAGVQVISASGAAGASANIKIRGAKSILGNNDPLFVIDGVPIDNSHLASGNPDDGANSYLSSVANSNRLIDIRQDDIESLTVLKGAAATALYGSQAGNGAIIITTKSGKLGTGKKGLNITYSTGLDFSKVNKNVPLQTQYGQGLYGALKTPQSGSSYAYGPKLDTMAWQADPTYLFDKNGTIVSQADCPTCPAVKPYDNLADVFTTGVTWTNAVSLSGASDNANFYLSFGYDKINGVIPNNTFGKKNITFNGSTKLSPKLNVGAAVNYINSGGNRIEQGSNTSGLMLGLLRTPPSFDNSNGYGNEAVDHKDSYTLPDGTQRKYRYGDRGYDNPFWVLNNSPLKDDVNRIIGNVNATYDLLDWLALSYKVGTDFYSDRRKQYFAIGSRTASSGRVSENQYFNRIFNADLIATADKQLTDIFHLNVVLGHNMRSDYLEQLYTQGDGLAIPDFYHISNTNSQIVRESVGKSRTAAIYSQVSLDFNRMVYLTLTGRNEWDTKLPKGNNSFFYPSASLGFVFTELPGLKDNKVLPFGKIRLSYGKTGSGGGYLYSTDNYYTLQSFADGWVSPDSYPLGGTSGFTASDGLGNPNLKPEITTSIETGLELKFFNNRLGFDVAYYKDNSKDLILNVPLAPSSGYTGSVLNAAELETKGIELMVNATPVKTNGFSWDINLNFSKIKNKVLKLAEGVDNVFIGGFEGAAIRAVVGESYGTMYGFGWYRDASGAVVIGSDGFPLLDDRSEQALGNTAPDWTMGLRNTLEWKGISLSALLDVKQGGIMWNGTRSALYFFGTHQETADLRGTTKVFDGNSAVYDADGNLVFEDHDNNPKTPDVVKTSGANTEEKIIDEDWLAFGNANGFFGNNSEDFVEDASWVRLRELSLSYDLPSKIFNKTPFTGLSISVTGRNIFLSTPYSGIDPETSLTGAGNAQGIDYFNMPNTKSWGVGLKLQF